MNARYYNGRMGRFVSEDGAFWDFSHIQTQLVDPQSWNSYAYGRNNPLRYNDPDGQFWDTAIDLGFTGMDVFNYGKNLAEATAGAVNIGIGSLMNNQRIINAGDAQLAQGVQSMNNLRGDLAIDAVGTALPFVPIAGLKGVGRAGEVGKTINRLPDEALVCRGGGCTVENFIRGNDGPLNLGKLTDVSVQSYPNTSLTDLVKSLKTPSGKPYGSVGYTTVGEIRKIGGDVVHSPTSSNLFHSTLKGTTPEAISNVMKIISNPFKK